MGAGAAFAGVQPLRDKRDEQLEVRHDRLLALRVIRHHLGDQPAQHGFDLRAAGERPHALFSQFRGQPASSGPQTIQLQPDPKVVVFRVRHRPGAVLFARIGNVEVAHAHRRRLAVGPPRRLAAREIEKLKRGVGVRLAVVSAAAQRLAAMRQRRQVVHRAVVEKTTDDLGIAQDFHERPVILSA